MNQLSHLISRCTTASEADRELDADIWWEIDRRSAASTYNRAALGLPKSFDEMPDTMPAGLGRLAVRVSAPQYSSSIDAALTLLPEDWRFILSDRAPDPHKGRAYIHNGENHFIGVAARPNPALRWFETTAPTIPLAICIVVLQKRLSGLTK